MPRSLRCLTLNLWGAEAPLEARMALVERGIAALAPDVVALQEVGDWPGLPNQAETLAERDRAVVRFRPGDRFPRRARGPRHPVPAADRGPRVAGAAPRPRRKNGASCCRRR